MSVGSVALGTLFKVAGGAVSSAYGAVAGSAKAIAAAGKNLQMVASDAAKAANASGGQSGEQAVTSSMGIAGSAGKQKVSIGKGKINKSQNVAKPIVSEKLPTEKLLIVAVNYLTSIDKTLKAQLQTDIRTVEEQTRADRESEIEGKKTSLKERLISFKSPAKEDAGIGKKVALAIGGIALAAGLLSTTLDETQIEKLKDNVDKFKKQFSWLGDLAGMVPAGGIMGFFLGLLRGKPFKGLVLGILTEQIAKSILGSDLDAEDYKARMFLGGALGFMGYRKLSKIRAGRMAPPAAGLADAVPTGKMSPAEMATYKAARKEGLTAKDAFRKMRVENPRGSFGELAKREAQIAEDIAAKKAKGPMAFFKGAKWKRFLGWLSRKGKKELVKKIEKRVAIAGASAAASATGIGTLPGVVTFLINLGLGLLTAWEIYNLYKLFTVEDENADITDAEIAKAATEVDAVSAAIPGGGQPSTGIKTKSETGNAEAAQAFFESKGWTKEQAAGIVGNLVVESGLKTDAFNESENAYGIAQWRAPRQADFNRVFGKDIRQSTFKEQLEFVNWELNNTEKASGDLLRQATTAAEAATIVDKKYERSAGYALQQRIDNANAIMGGDYAGLKGGGGGSGSALTGELGQTFKSAAEMLGKFSSIFVQPGVARDDIFPKPSNVSSQINNESMKIQNDMAFGTTVAKNKETVEQPVMPGVIPGTKAPRKSISPIDPNYNPNNVIGKYLAHFVDAA